jgi:magnesium-transporting ATPase (P-type)
VYRGDVPGDSNRTNPLRTALRRLVLGAFCCAVAMIVLLIGMAVLGVTGLSFDPHGYGMLFGILLAVVLAPVALMLWITYRMLR